MNQLRERVLASWQFKSLIWDISGFPLINHLVLPGSESIFGIPWWLNGKESTCNARHAGLDPWVDKSPWRRKWQPTPVFLPGKSLGQRSLAGYSPWGCERVGQDWVTNTFLFSWLFSLNEPDSNTVTMNLMGWNDQMIEMMKVSQMVVHRVAL